MPESVSFGLAALAGQFGAECVGRTHVRDDLPRMEDVARAAIDDADLVVVSGGASVGEKDFAKRMFEPLGLELVFSRVSIKPGKPVWLGRVGQKLVIGLPGNPTSALVTARLLLAPLLAGLSGRRVDEALRWRTLPVAASLGPCGDRETFHRARSADGAAEIIAFQDFERAEGVGERRPAGAAARTLARARSGSSGRSARLLGAAAGTQQARSRWPLAARASRRGSRRVAWLLM